MNFATDTNPHALAQFHQTLNTLHDGLATALTQNGAEASADEHRDSLEAKGTVLASPAGAPPNPADHAIAAYQSGIVNAMLAFAQAHLPAKFRPGVTAALKGIDDAMANAQPSTLVKDAIEAGVAVTAALNPTAGAIAAEAAPYVEAVTEVAIAARKAKQLPKANQEPSS